MSVSSELLCSFELLKPLDSNALKNHIKKGRNKRNHMLNSPVSNAHYAASFLRAHTDNTTASERLPPKRLIPQHGRTRKRANQHLTISSSAKLRNNRLSLPCMAPRLGGFTSFQGRYRFSARKWKRKKDGVAITRGSKMTAVHHCVRQDLHSTWSVGAVPRSSGKDKCCSGRGRRSVRLGGLVDVTVFLPLLGLEWSRRDAVLSAASNTTASRWCKFGTRRGLSPYSSAMDSIHISHRKRQRRARTGLYFHSYLSFVSSWIQWHATGVGSLKLLCILRERSREPSHRGVPGHFFFSVARLLYGAFPTLHG